MTVATEHQRPHLELAFESSTAILALEGFNDNEESKELQQRILAGELDFEAAIRVAMNRARARALPLE